MRSLLALSLTSALVLLLPACGSTPKPGPDDADAAAVSSDVATDPATTGTTATAAPSSSTPAIRRVRFEVTEIARIETASRVELWLPIASVEHGVQEIEKLEVVVKPDTRHEITSDGHGNRVLYLKARGPVEVIVKYRVLRTELRADLTKAEKRALTSAEKSAMAAELRPTTEPALAEHRAAGRPARRAVGAQVESFEEGLAAPYAFTEVYYPGLAWVPYQRLEDPQHPPEEVSVLPADVLVVARGSRHALPFGNVDGVKTWIRATFSGRLLDAP